MKSMTGYGRARGLQKGFDVTIEIKSVNHRYFELIARIPRSYMQLEDRVRGYLQSRILRGKIEVNINIDDSETEIKNVKLNKPLMHAYMEALADVGTEFSIPFDATATLALGISDVIRTVRDEVDIEMVWTCVAPVLAQATDAFIEQREREGERLSTDIVAKCCQIQEIVDKIEQRAPQLLEEYITKLRVRIEELLGDGRVDEQRLLTEVAIMADRMAIDEEIVRLNSHCAALREQSKEEDANGKKLDFIIQEMNREINTISSKIGDLQVTRQVIEVKNLIEKIREQVQNIE